MLIDWKEWFTRFTPERKPYLNLQREKRFSVEIFGLGKSELDQKTYQFEIVNVSLNGICVRAQAPFLFEDRFAIKVCHSPEKWFSISARPLWKRGETYGFEIHEKGKDWDNWILSIAKKS